jgi:hypothetical protein
MAQQSGSTHFQVKFKSALQAYEKKTGIKLEQHPHALHFQCCHSVDSIITLLQCQAQAFGNFREYDRIMGSIKTTISILTALSTVVSLADAVGPVRQKVS